MLGEPEFFAPKAPLAGSVNSPQTAVVGAASTAEQLIADNSTGGAVYEFVATTLCHVKFGVTTMGAATTADIVCGAFVRRFYIDPAIITHVRVIQSAAGGFISFHRVR